MADYIVIALLQPMENSVCIGMNGHAFHVFFSVSFKTVDSLADKGRTAYQYASLPWASKASNLGKGSRCLVYCFLFFFSWNSEEWCHSR